MRFEGKDKGIAMELLQILKKAVKHGKFILASGKKSDFYINVKEVYCDPKASRLIGKKLALALKKSRAKRIAGLELGAVPLATIASVYSGKPFLMVRKKPKGHGTKKLIEGVFKKGERCAIIEDVITTGESAIGTAKTLRKYGLIPTEVIAVVDREEGGKEAFQRGKIPFKALYSKSQLL